MAMSGGLPQPARTIAAPHAGIGMPGLACPSGNHPDVTRLAPDRHLQMFIKSLYARVGSAAAGKIPEVAAGGHTSSVARSYRFRPKLLMHFTVSKLDVRPGLSYLTRPMDTSALFSFSCRLWCRWGPVRQRPDAADAGWRYSRASGAGVTGHVFCHAGCKRRVAARGRFASERMADRATHQDWMHRHPRRCGRPAAGACGIAPWPWIEVAQREGFPPWAIVTIRVDGWNDPLQSRLARGPLVWIPAGY